MSAATDSWITGTNNWLDNLQEEAEKARLMEQIDKLVENDSGYKEKIEIVNKQIEMIDKKRKELVIEKQKIHVEFANRYLKAKNSKYRMKLGTKEDCFNSIFKGL